MKYFCLFFSRYEKCTADSPISKIYAVCLQENIFCLNQIFIINSGLSLDFRHKKSNLVFITHISFYIIFFVCRQEQNVKRKFQEGFGGVVKRPGLKQTQIVFINTDDLQNRPTIPLLETS